jgi:hypothetical protein
MRACAGRECSETSDENGFGCCYCHDSLASNATLVTLALLAPISCFRAIASRPRKKGPRASLAQEGAPRKRSLCFEGAVAAFLMLEKMAAMVGSIGSKSIE